MDILNTIKGLDAENGGFWNRVGNLFEQMEIAEAEIDKVKHAHPDKADILHDCFKLMCPQFPMSERIYRAHCRELLERAYNGVDTRPATKAEVLLGLSEWSLEHVPAHDVAALMGRLFVQTFPDYDVGELPRESYAGAADELFAKLQRKATVETREL